MPRMLARWLRTIVVFLLAAGAAGAWAGGLHSPVAIALVSIAVPIGIVAVLVGLSHAIAGINPMRGGAREIVDSALQFLVVQAFPAQCVDAAVARAVGTPVLMVHGYCCNRGAHWLLARRLAGSGFRPILVDLEPVHASIDDYVDALAVRIDAILAHEGVARVPAVAHSMGGLALRAYAARHGGGKLGPVVTIGTPHRGTRLARLGMGANAGQMRPGSDWLRELPAPAAADRWLALWSTHDNIVAPQEGGRLDGSKDLRFEGIGHMSLLADRAVADAVASHLRGTGAD